MPPTPYQKFLAQSTSSYPQLLNSTRQPTVTVHVTKLRLDLRWATIMMMIIPQLTNIVNLWIALVSPPLFDCLEKGVRFLLNLVAEDVDVVLEIDTGDVAKETNPNINTPLRGSAIAVIWQTTILNHFTSS